ncbi:MAG: hypothetical protein B7Y36_07010 [Novosphingobium sp. 28-62-57]|uniref:hypothetical protein n=1 Tax=unclassified Novosphingobium TaxID=2644732 RepID=UPI000BDD05AF|nr:MULTISPECIES: hypothetical protein [unclassified Novosphingobium]OYW51074.1 MAG: hypothetical protein B7Z34_02010 [Novosphingobium sp. 12-62-10]OYZ11105.1 MAG: hypothetical protein B7Y36_07010 [Novosphingobium sp. 28-62-57]OZA35892.1 MAG: hypothetical protein B7X92_08515 [Novosphingobium sp. 17-62-9]HQS69478.1 hypothetical protein [Novosphingobium sp.]
MPAQNSPSETSARFSSLIESMARPHDVRGLSIKGLHMVMAMRLCALFDAAGQDPLPDLARRYRSIEAAFAVHGLVQTIKKVWPEPFLVNRPCCHAMTPDEVTLAALARTTRAGNRDAFTAAMAGFVRAERHEALYNATIHAVALLP